MANLPLFGFLLILAKSSHGYYTAQNLSTNPNDVGFYLFPNPKDFTDFDRLTYMDLNSVKNSRYSPNKKVIILIHGFTQNFTSDFPTVLIKAYLNAGFGSSSNIIGIDWGKLSGTGSTLDPVAVQDLDTLPLYTGVVSNVPVVGKRISDFLIFLKANQLISGPDAVHLVGQSLGAHVSGMAGKYYKQSTSTALKRITGTDPAGPIFQFKSVEERLDRTDAKFVDIVHTNQGMFGFLGPLGHVDFFVNGGGPIQPSCADTLSTDPFCSHNTAPHYYAKSIADPSLQGTRPIFLLFPPYVETFGEFCPETARGYYGIDLSL